VTFIDWPDRCCHPSWNIDMQTYLTRKEVAKKFPITESTLASLAHQGRGPRYFRPTAKVLYRPEDVDAWIAASVVEPAPGNPARTRYLGGRPRQSRGTYAAGHPFEPQLPAGSGRKSLPPSPKSILRKKA
jgi:Helix-turn-helix domain